MTDINTLISERFGRKTDAGRGRDAEILTKILEHRSIRKYQNKKVSEDLIETLLACAQSAPTKSDLQQYAILRLTDKKKKSRLANYPARGYRSLTHRLGFLRRYSPYPKNILST